MFKNRLKLVGKNFANISMFFPEKVLYFTLFLIYFSNFLECTRLCSMLLFADKKAQQGVQINAAQIEEKYEEEVPAAGDAHPG